MLTMLATRLGLFVVWIVAYFVCLLLILSFLVLHYAFPETAPQYIRDVTSIYAPYLTPIVTFWLVEDEHDRPTRNSVASTIALSISTMFNLIMVGFLASVFFRAEAQGVIEETLKTMTAVATILAFLVGPAIGYFFSKDSRAARPPARQRQRPGGP